MNYIVKWVAWNIVKPVKSRYNIIYFKEYNEVAGVLQIPEHLYEWIVGGDK